MNDKDSLNLIEEIKQLKETIVDLNKNLKTWIENQSLGSIDANDFLSMEEGELPELQPSPNDSLLELEDTDCPDYITKEFIEIQKQMIPILKEWIKEHKKSDEWKNEQ